MADDRLELIMKLNEPQYAKDSPILLDACALYFDKESRNYIAQLKWKNIGKEKIKAVSIDLCFWDAFDELIKTISHQYVNLSAGTGSFFGDKEAIIFNGESALRYDVSLKAVSYIDGDVFRPENELKFEKLPSPKEIQLSGEILEQYKRDLEKIGHKPAFRYQSQTVFNIWQCGCGCWQYTGTPCLNCGILEDDLKRTANLHQLEDNLSLYKKEKTERERIAEEARLAQEKANEKRREEEEKQRQIQAEIDRENAAKEAIKKKKKIQKATLIAAGIAVCITVVCILNYYIIPKGHYSKGESLVASQQWDEAISEFEAAGNFGDAATQILATRYKEGETKRNKRDWEGAIAAFLLAENYSDYDVQIKKTLYDKGEWLLQQNDSISAAEAFLAAGTYQDAKTRYSEIIYQAAENLYNSGQFMKAKQQFMKISHYKESNQYILSINNQFNYRLIEFEFAIIGITNEGNLLTVGKAPYHPEALETIKGWKNIDRIIEYHNALIGLTKDGSLLTRSIVTDPDEDMTRFCRQIHYWKNIQSIHGLRKYFAAMTTDGSFYAAPAPSVDDLLPNFRDWNNIKRLSDTHYDLFGKKKDGTVVSTEKSLCNWNDVEYIVPIGTTSFEAGLTADGTVVVNKYGQSYYMHEKDPNWIDIVEIGTISQSLYGLKSDGTILISSISDEKELSQETDSMIEIKKWNNVVSVYYDTYEGTFAIKSDGTVVTDNEKLKGVVANWKDMVALYFVWENNSNVTTLGLKADGTVVAASSELNNRLADMDLW